MRIITLYNKKTKEAANFDDQPNFYMPRYKREQDEVLFSDDGLNNNAEDVKRIWKKKKKRNKKYKNPQEVKNEWPDISKE